MTGVKEKSNWHKLVIMLNVADLVIDYVSGRETYQQIFWGTQQYGGGTIHKKSTGENIMNLKSIQVQQMTPI